MSSPSIFDELTAQNCDFEPESGLPRLQRTYLCRCGSAIFFRNSFCLNCRTPLGYEPYLGKVIPIDPGPDPETWKPGVDAPGAAALYWRCANTKTAALCNWLIPLSGINNPQPFCKCCRLNRTIPDLSVQENRGLWASIELAKRRVVSALMALGLPVESRVSEDTQRGLAFDLLRSVDSSHRVLTGHDDGLITLNIEEADDVKREEIRKKMREPYRTLVGHLRHEVGHYYWDRLIAGTQNLNPCRELFGDERADYELALKRNYEQGPQPNWRSLYVSSYASVHPWEDWAETWAHYMHMLDTLSTAASVGLKPETVEMPVDPFTSAALYQEGVDKQCFLSLLNSWVKLTAVLNELSRSMGQPDFYPFALPYAAVAKLHFIHSVIRQANP